MYKGPFIQKKIYAKESRVSPVMDTFKSHCPTLLKTPPPPPETKIKILKKPPLINYVFVPLKLKVFHKLKVPGSTWGFD